MNETICYVHGCDALCSDEDTCYDCERPVYTQQSIDIDLSAEAEGRDMLLCDDSLRLAIQGWPVRHPASLKLDTRGKLSHFTHAMKRLERYSAAMLLYSSVEPQKKGVP